MKRENDSPTSVFKAFIIAQQNGDIEAVKSMLTENALREIERVSVSRNTTFYESVILYGNKISGHLVPGTSPNTRRELISGELSCVEAKNSITNEFDTFSLKKENNVWKLALDYIVVDVVKVDTSVFERLICYLRKFFD
jgi:hypothetical protein